MTPVILNTDELKFDLMIFGLEHDFFGYGTQVDRRSDGKIKVVCDGETYYYTRRDIINEWNNIDSNEKEDIVNLFTQEILLNL